MALKFRAKKLSKAILDKRTKDNLSFRNIQDQSGIDKSTLQRIEDGAAVPNVETFASICHWLNKPITEFIHA